MSALSEGSTPVHDSGTQPAIDTSHLQQYDPQVQQQQLQQQQPPPGTDAGRSKPRRSSPIPRIRRACTACHAGKTRCSEVLPCQSCLKRGLGATCAYPDPETTGENTGQPPASAAPTYMAPTTFSQMPAVPAQYYYDYASGSSTSAFRSNKRPRNLTEEEAAAITRNFQRGDFYVGSSAPVRIDPRLPVRLTLGEGDHVHFAIGEPIV
ncbi:hypothetical protein BD410DRAFT_782130 [Rickenella mellea]|uniref:Zn(2)-C6 fungal-type domain-containing protein n=1 Tax=Rickenella mellea TaxID=50990 RepID=A0A4Y7QKH4_9AGAM|nr:hypothetical protein BD410DRAFT_782130 [Rickenella mellea]